ncbi:hypothetical protein Pcinc_037281 [Petrolisthes cinctipes]|uniref:Arrestin C-terminal-like domain-containing protein n=1 Tax=Petrolisthes cinctipes TaxID=88211 RepID=A0AAE1ELP2_PETCI|nr:hypothetical protein Pcinc_037281 [Petrolisthes cinctipes]
MGKPCGVDYELKAYVGDNVDDKPHKRNSVRLAIRKVMYAPMKQGDQPSVEVSKEFMMSPNKLHLEASLDKELYYHGETVAVNVHIQNNSNKSVKKIKVSIRQFADICLFSTAQYKCTVAEVESEDGCPVGPGFTLSKVLHLTPLLLNNKDKRGLALDGQLKHEDTNLASSSIITDSSQKENLGIIVQYKVKVKLNLGPLVGDLVAELPFTLMHPKPEEEPENNKPAPPAASSPSQDSETTPPVDTNLIELDTRNANTLSTNTTTNTTATTSTSVLGGNVLWLESLIAPLRTRLEQVVEKLSVGRVRVDEDTPPPPPPTTTKTTTIPSVISNPNNHHHHHATRSSVISNPHPHHQATSSSIISNHHQPPNTTSSSVISNPHHHHSYTTSSSVISNPHHHHSYTTSSSVISNPHATCFSEGHSSTTTSASPSASPPTREPHGNESCVGILDLIDLSETEDDDDDNDDDDDDVDGTTCYADQDDDIIFEDFARLRLKGETEA